MNAIRDRVKDKIGQAIVYQRDVDTGITTISIQSTIKSILSIKELAIVDREAELPYFTRHKSEEIERLTKGEVYGLALIDMLKEGWVKEIKAVDVSGKS